MLRAGREHFPFRVGRGRGGGSEISTVAPVSWGGPGYAARRKQTAVKSISTHVGHRRHHSR